jgi:hypothetical protein
MVAASLLLASCAGTSTIRLSYVPPPPAPVLRPQLVVVGFADRRGWEGDGNVYRIGGIYGGFGNRLGIILLNEPLPPRLLAALVAEFRAAGVDAAGLERLPADPPLALPWLEGDLRNFSTEARWGRQADVSAIVRLRAPGGLVLVEKQIKGAATTFVIAGQQNTKILQQLLDSAFAEFVRNVATDPEIRAALTTMVRPPVPTPAWDAGL